MQVVRCVLEVPEQLAGLDVEREIAVGIEVGAKAAVTVGIRVRVADRPVENACIGVGAACGPCGAAALLQRTTLPSVGDGPSVSGIGNGVELPKLLAGSRVVSSDESANPLVAAADTGDHQVPHDKRRRRTAIEALRAGLGGCNIPQQSAGQPVQRDEVRIVGEIEDAVSQDSDTAIHADGRVAGDRRSRALGTLIVPYLAAGASADGIHLVVAGHIHHAIHDHRRSLQREVRNGVGPL